MPDPIESPDPIETQEPAPVPAAEAPTPAPQPTPTHNRYLVQQAVELGITPDEIGQSTSDELQQAVYHRSRALAAFRQPTAAVGVAAPPVPEPEPDLGMTPEELAELQELNPVVAKALKASAKIAHEAKKKAESEAQNFRAHSAQQELERQIGVEMDTKHSAVLGVGTSAEISRKRAVLAELSALANMGVINNQTPPQVAVAMAVKNLFDVSAPAARPASPPPAPAPTPTARPTNRFGGGEDGDINTIEDLADLWEKTIREKAVSEKASKNANGSFRP